MKALSIKQPWANLIAHGIKDIENRTWKTHFRGRVYIHASGKFADVNFTTEQIADLDKNNIWYSGAGLPSEMTLVSAIIGEVDIIDCVVDHPSVWAEKGFHYASYDGTQYKEVYNWVLANPVFYDKPILNVKGKLSFWEVDIDIVECVGCSQKFDREEMQEDDSEEKFCSEC